MGENATIFMHGNIQNKWNFRTSRHFHCYSFGSEKRGSWNFMMLYLSRHMYDAFSDDLPNSMPRGRVKSRQFCTLYMGNLDFERLFLKNISSFIAYLKLPYL